MTLAPTKQPTWVWLTAGIVATVGIGVADVIADARVSFLSLYFAPVLLVTWSVGRTAGYAVSGLSFLMWIIDDIHATHLARQPAVALTNLAGNFLLLMVFAYAIAALKTSQEREKATALEAYDRELQVAREVQARLLPSRVPHLPGVLCAAGFRPASRVAGDYYDLIALPDGRLAFLVADVSGKGLPASLLMASLQGMVRGLAGLLADRIEDLVGELNRMLYVSTESNRYATFFYASYDPATHRLTYVNAGHNPPLLVRIKDRSIQYLEAGGLPVGLLSSTSYDTGEIVVEPGDTFIGFTDGITEATGERGEFLGQDRLEALARTNHGTPPEDLRDLIMREVAAFTGSMPQADDETLLIARFS